MSKKDTFKNILNEKININQIYDEILLKVEREEKKSMKRSLKYILAPICLMLIVVCGVLVINNQKNILKPIIDDCNDIVYINKVSKENATKLDAEVQMIEQNVSVKGGRFETIEELNDYQFYKDLEISDEYNAFVIYAIYVRSDINISEYNKLNNYVISYKVKDKEKDFKNIKIAFSKENKPLRDYYFTSENDKKSTINGVELQIFQYGTTYMTIFKYDGINFDIETYNVSETELINLLKSIII